MRIKKITKKTVILDDTGNVDYNVYIDTDSVYFLAEPLVKHRYPNYKEFDQNRMADEVNGIADETQTFLN